MFDQVKEMNKLRKQGKLLQKEAEKITVEVEEGDIKVVMRGDQKIEEIIVGGEERGDLKKAINKAVKETQKKVSKKLAGMFSGMDLPGF